MSLILPLLGKMQPAAESFPLVDASAPAWLHKSSLVWPSSAFTMAIRFKYSNANSNQFFFHWLHDAAFDSLIYLRILSGTTLYLYVVDTSNVRKNLTATVSLTNGVEYYLLISASAADGAVAYLNDSNISLGGTNTAGSWNTTNAGETTALSYVTESAGNTPAPTELGSIWVDDSYLDFSTEANRRKFHGSDMSPVSLGGNGETPTGSSPLIYFAGDAAAWNSGVNLGTGGNFDTGATGWDSFTDV